MTKAHILIVEDEALLYHRMATVLKKNNYSVSEYIPSVAKAIESINKQRPDIALLDIELQGELTGINLGKMLHDDYHIPFIYITSLDDNQTFHAGLNTQHEQFIVKTKPRLNPQEIVRAIQTVLRRTQENSQPTIPTVAAEGVTGLVDYLDKIKDYGISQVTRVPVPYSDVAFFTTAAFPGRAGEKETVRTNYLRFITKENKRYFLKSSLRELQRKLPYNFVRINDQYIINLSPQYVVGRTSRSCIRIQNEDLIIKDTYRHEFQKRMEELYPS